ncbi:hypothetical protein [Streptomyces sp. NPDC058486]|uniref:AMP-binding enzyme n=1 Tax=unclassified Streptomyces TaxID=2593676 RepID=UPI003662E888
MRATALAWVFVVDRLKGMIIYGGDLARHPSVAAVAVVGLPDPHWGERVHAVVVRRPGVEVTADQLIAHARTRIAGYKVPRSVEFADSLPVSAQGKILKRVLRERDFEALPLP